MTDDELQRALAQVALVNLVNFDAALGRRGRRRQPLTVGEVLAAPDDAPGHQIELDELRRALAERSTAWASASATSWRSTTTTASPWPRSARSSA